MGWTISTLSPSFRGVSAYCDRRVTSRFRATAVNSRRTFRCESRPSTVRPGGSSIGLPLTVTIMKKPHAFREGCGLVVLRVAFPSLELPSAGSRGPVPHPVLRKPPPATRSGLYPSVELACERLRVGHRQLADVVLAHVGGGPSVDGRALGQQRQAGGARRALLGAHHHPVGLVASDNRAEQRGERGPLPRPPHQGDLRHRPQV